MQMNPEQMDAIDKGMMKRKLRLFLGSAVLVCVILIAGFGLLVFLNERNFFSPRLQGLQCR